MPSSITVAVWYAEHDVYRLLWSPYVIGQSGQTIIFLPGGFFLSFFFPCLISAAADWMSTIAYFDTQCGLSANLECRPEMCCTRLAENIGRKNDANDILDILYRRF